jgi:hypothetical protein
MDHPMDGFIHHLWVNGMVHSAHSAFNFMAS